MPHQIMTEEHLRDFYLGYLDCLNAQDWERLGQFVHSDVEYNGTVVGLIGYRGMLKDDFRAIPDLRFDARILMADPPRIACRLQFDCTPRGMLFDVPVNGKRVRFCENVIYELAAKRIYKVWSVIDKTAVAQQIRP